jgi:hypothetical protein
MSRRYGLGERLRQQSLRVWEIEREEWPSDAQPISCSAMCGTIEDEPGAK